jgi:hypothetical protein
MAAWQFSMHLVPRAQLEAVCPGMNAAFPGQVFDDTPWWCDRQPPGDLPDRVSAVLQEVASSDPASRQWGESSGNTVAVSYVDGRIEEIRARLDLRRLDRNVVRVLARLALDCDGWWIGGDARERIPVGRTRHAIMTAVVASDAAQFVADPHAFLEDIHRNREHEER